MPTPQVQTLLDQYATPQFASQSTVNAGAGAISTLVASIQKQVIEYTSEVDTIEQNSPDPTLIGPLEELYQTLGAMQREADNLGKALRSTTMMQAQWVAYMERFKANVLPPTSVTVTSASPIPVGQTGQAMAAAIAANGTITPRTFTWTTSDATIATVDAKGLVTGVAAGTVTITATSNDGVAGTVSVTIQ